MSFNIIRSLVLLSVIISLLISCDDKQQLETRSGLKVDLIKKGEDTPAIKGGIAMLNISYETEDGKVLFSSEERGGAVPVRMTDEDKGLLDEVVDILNVGDSVIFEIPAEDLFEKTYGTSLPDSIARGSKLRFYLGLENTLTMTAYEGIMEEEREKQMQVWKKAEKEQLEKEIAAIDSRLDEGGEKYQKLDSGVRLIIQKEGSGEKPQNGDLLNVYYEGRYFETGEEFDARSKDEKPLSFRLGSGVIQGWNEAFATLKEGAEATIYVPSSLGYGPVDYQSIPANSILVFNVELVKVEK
ncbi:MAG: FKBP-type peptidyl-prolyl cis-trans isomerase [Cyclobacteriaceae bacterium]